MGATLIYHAPEKLSSARRKKLRKRGKLEYQLHVENIGHYGRDSVHTFMESMVAQAKKPRVQIQEYVTQNKPLLAIGLICFVILTILMCANPPYTSSAWYRPSIGMLTVFSGSIFALGYIGKKERRRTVVPGRASPAWEKKSPQDYKHFHGPLPPEAESIIEQVGFCLPGCQFIIHRFEKDPFLELVYHDKETDKHERFFVYHWDEPGFSL